jgi:hypothetical protein
MKRRIGSLALLVIVLSMFTCIDPYTPRLNGYKSVLVVEGLITDENIPGEVKISRSVVSRDSTPEVVDDAYVTITDEDNNVTILDNYSGGLYKTDTNIFTGEIGKVYTLHITMSDGSEYISDPSQMLPVPDIDSVYYEAEEIISDTQNEILKGIRIYVDSEETGGGNNYFRWEVEETWKFRLPSPKKYNYISESLIVEVDTVKEYCWRSNNPGMILTRAVFPEQPFIEREPLIFISSSMSDRLLIRYSALIKQYSLTKKEYDFWNNLFL